jgi:NADPH2:quinone reductase
MKALVCNSYGIPSEVVRIETKNEPKPGSGEVLVRMILSPVNPSDMLFIQGKYGNQPTPPQTPGFEGVGIVEAGKGLLAWRCLLYTSDAADD